MKCIRVLAVFSSLLALSLRGDTIELKTGERIEGTFKQATSAGAVIEVGGQSITIPLEKVQAIYFGIARPLGTVTAPPSAEALDALRAVRSTVQSNFTFRDYQSRVLDAKIKSDKYLGISASATGQADLRSTIRLATRLYELASAALDGDLALFLIPDNDLVSKCPVAGKLADPQALKHVAALRELGMPDYARDALTKLAGQPAHQALWSCASAQLAQAERLSTQH